MAFVLVRSPVLCNYYLTYRCNAKCHFCDIWEKPSPYATETSVKENLRDLKRLGVKVIDFTGGEPLLHRQLPEFLSLAKKLGFITTVTTNTLLYPKYAQRLRGLVDMLHFSLDSPIREEHNASRGVACFDHFMESIQIARSLGEQPDILFTVTNQSIRHLPEVYHHISQKNGLILILNPVFEYNSVGEDLTQSIVQELRPWAKKSGVYLNEAFLTLRENGGNKTNAPICRAASTTIVISPENALLLPCYHLTHQSFPITGNLYDLYHQSEVQAAIKLEGRLPGCEGCTINCYMQPSFATQISRYFWEALPATIKYSLEKWVY